MATRGQKQPNEYSNVVRDQPREYQEPPAPLPGFPPGFETLAPLDSVMVKHRDIELRSAWNKYEVFNKAGQSIFQVDEQPGDLATRRFLAPNRAFDIDFRSPNLPHVVLRMQRDTKIWTACCCADGSGYWPIQVFDMAMKKVGMLRMRQSYCSFVFGVHDSTDRLMYLIAGKICRCGDDVDFPVTNGDSGLPVGNIGKHNPGCETSTYVVDFPLDMDGVSKTLLLASVFMIEYILYGNELAGEQYAVKTGNMTRYLPHSHDGH